MINRLAEHAPPAIGLVDASTGVRYYPVPGMGDPGAFGARVSDDSMSPAYSEGDVVVFSPAADIADGIDALILLGTVHRLTFRRVFEDGDRLRLQPLNPAHRPETITRADVQGIFRAVYHFRRLIP